jgi:hypothetical protein
MAAMVAAVSSDSTGYGDDEIPGLARFSVDCADALIAKLAEGQPDLDAMALVLSHEGHIEKQDAEIARLRAELAKYTGDLTDEQKKWLAKEYGADMSSWGYRDAAIRRVRSWEGEG